MRKNGSVDASDYISLAIGGFIALILFFLLFNYSAKARSETQTKVEDERLQIESYNILNGFIEQNAQLILRDYLAGEPHEYNKFGITKAFTANQDDELAYSAAEYFFEYYGSRNIEWALDIQDSSDKEKNRIQSPSFNRDYRIQNSVKQEFPLPNKDYLVFNLYYRKVG